MTEENAAEAQERALIKGIQADFEEVKRIQKAMRAKAMKVYDINMEAGRFDAADEAYRFAASCTVALGNTEMQHATGKIGLNAHWPGISGEISAFGPGGRG